jgi:hypothetical protein
MTTIKTYITKETLLGAGFRSFAFFYIIEFTDEKVTKILCFDPQGDMREIGGKHEYFRFESDILYSSNLLDFRLGLEAFKYLASI